jgi:hypothetical protein
MYFRIYIYLTVCMHSHHVNHQQFADDAAMHAGGEARRFPSPSELIRAAYGSFFLTTACHSLSFSESDALL